MIPRTHNGLTVRSAYSKQQSPSTAPLSNEHTTTSVVQSSSSSSSSNTAVVVVEAQADSTYNNEVVLPTTTTTATAAKQAPPLYVKRKRQTRRQPAQKRPHGYWSSSDNLRTELIHFWAQLESSNATSTGTNIDNQHEENTAELVIPNERILIRYERHDLRAAIANMGGREAVANLLGSAWSIMPGNWKEAVRQHPALLHKLMDKDKDLAPFRHQSRRDPKRRQQQQQQQQQQQDTVTRVRRRRSKGYWHDPENMKRELLNFWRDRGLYSNNCSSASNHHPLYQQQGAENEEADRDFLIIPNERLLVRYKRQDLGSAILRLGGREAVVRLLGGTPRIMPGKWSDAVQEFPDLVQQLTDQDKGLAPHQERKRRRRRKNGEIKQPTKEDETPNAEALSKGSSETTTTTTTTTNTEAAWSTGRAALASSAPRSNSVRETARQSTTTCPTLEADEQSDVADNRNGQPDADEEKLPSPGVALYSPLPSTGNTNVPGPTTRKGSKHWTLTKVLSELYAYTDRCKKRWGRPSVWMPRLSELGSEGRNDLKQALNRVNKGEKGICSIAGMVPYHEWYYFEGQLELCVELKQYIDIYGNGDYTVFPAASEIKQNGHHQLYLLIQNYGGRKFLSARLGMRAPHKCKGAVRKGLCDSEDDEYDDDDPAERDHDEYDTISYGRFDLEFAIRLLEFVRKDQLARHPPLRYPVIPMPSPSKILNAAPKEEEEGIEMDRKIHEFGGYESVARRLGLALQPVQQQQQQQQK